MPDKKELGRQRFEELSPEGAQKMIDLLSDIAPQLMHNMFEFPFGDLYCRTNLDIKIRQTVTLSVLAALNREAELKIHVDIAKKLGFTKEELVEIFNQCAPYAGFPAAMSGVRITKEVFQD